MILLLVIGLVIAMVLGTTGAVSPWLSVLIMAAGVWVLVLQLRQKAALAAAMNTRKSELKADQAILLRHIGGLNLPIEATVGLYLFADRMILESEDFRIELNRSQSPRLTLLNAGNHDALMESISPQPDDPAGLRVLPELKERIRRHDRSIRANRILLLTYEDGGPDRSLAAFLTGLSRTRVRKTLSASGWYLARAREPSDKTRH